MYKSNPSDAELRSILTDAKTIAVVGASSDPNKSSHGVLRKLLAVGYRVYPVNPHEQTVLGQKAYGSLTEVPEKIDIVDVFRRPEFTPQVADDAVAVGAKILWLQQGIVNEEAAKRAQAGGLKVIMDRCIAVDHAVLKVPRK
jgi:uncharacterized protein